MNKTSQQVTITTQDRISQQAAEQYYKMYNNVNSFFVQFQQDLINNGIMETKNKKDDVVKANQESLFPRVKFEICYEKPRFCKIEIICEASCYRNYITIRCKTFVYDEATGYKLDKKIPHYRTHHFFNKDVSKGYTNPDNFVMNFLKDTQPIKTHSGFRFNEHIFEDDGHYTFTKHTIEKKSILISARYGGVVYVDENLKIVKDSRKMNNPNIKDIWFMFDIKTRFGNYYVLYDPSKKKWASCSKRGARVENQTLINNSTAMSRKLVLTKEDKVMFDYLLKQQI